MDQQHLIPWPAIVDPPPDGNQVQTGDSSKEDLMFMEMLPKVFQDSSLITRV